MSDESDIERRLEQQEQEQKHRAQLWFRDGVLKSLDEEGKTVRSLQLINRTILELNFVNIFSQTNRKLSFEKRLRATVELILSGGEWPSFIFQSNVPQNRQKGNQLARLLREALDGLPIDDKKNVGASVTRIR